MIRHTAALIVTAAALTLSACVSVDDPADASATTPTRSADLDDTERSMLLARYAQVISDGLGGQDIADTCDLSAGTYGCFYEGMALPDRETLVLGVAFPGDVNSADARDEVEVMTRMVWNNLLAADAADDLTVVRVVDTGLDMRMHQERRRDAERR